jgi:hypothetical protein
VTLRFAAAGDCNLHWVVDIVDAADFRSGATYDTGLPPSLIEGDYTCDGMVDLLDAASFLSSGLFDAGVCNLPTGLSDGAVAAASEPSATAIVLIGLACDGCSVWRRRICALRSSSVGEAGRGELF